MIDVAEEKVQRGEALREALLDFGPFAGGDDAGKKIVGENALGAFLAAVDGEGDAFVQEGEVGGLLAAAQFLRSKLEQSLVEGAVVLPRNAGGREHFVVGGIDLVVHKGWWDGDT